MKCVNFYYFSGTGNTLLVVRRMAEVFEENGIEVNLHRIEKMDPKDVDRGCTVGLAFPVACQGTYPFVWRFVEQMPETDGTPVFMVNTLASFSGGVVGPMREILRKKGYAPIGAKEIVMPNNLTGMNSEKENRRVIRRGLKTAGEYARAIIEGTAKWGRVPILSDIMSKPSRDDKKAWRLFRRLFPHYIDLRLCTRCGLCAELCPVGDIVMEDYPVHIG